MGLKTVTEFGSTVEVTSDEEKSSAVGEAVRGRRRSVCVCMGGGMRNMCVCVCVRASVTVCVWGYREKGEGFILGTIHCCIAILRYIAYCIALYKFIILI